MAKGFTIVAMVVAAVIVVLFGLDLVIRFPFGRDNSIQMLLADLTFLISGLLLAYISWTTFREIK